MLSHFVNFSFRSAVGERCAHSAIWELSDSSAVGEENVFLAICKLDCFDARFFNSLNGAVREDAFLFSVFKDALDGAVRKTKGEIIVGLNLHYLLGAVWEVLLDLLVLKLKDLKTVRVGCLSSLCFSEEVNHPLIWVRLLYVFVRKINDQVTIWICFSSDAIRENDLFLPRLVNSLYFTVVANHLVNYLLTVPGLLVVPVVELQTVVFFLLVCNLLIILLSVEVIFRLLVLLSRLWRLL